MQPLISVIVPVYNGERYLKNCIESIEAQSYEPLEIIVINDGSTDRTAEVCEKLVQSYGNLSFITTEDLGVSASRNHGIALAKGELLTFVDADDRIHPQMLQRLYGAMEQTGSDIAGCRFTIWNTEREWEIVANSVPVGDQTYKLYEKQEYLRDQILCGNSRCWSKLYRKALLQQMHTEEWFREGMTIGEDMLFLMDLLPKTETIVEIDFHGYGYYQNPQGAMNRTFRPEYMDQIRCWEIAREQVRRLLPECESKATSILLISIMLNQPIKGKGFFRLIFFLPVIIVSGPILGMLNAEGAGSITALDTQAITDAISGFLPAALAKPISSIFENMITILWYSGVQILIFLSALQTISPSMFEAAKIEGCTAWESFWKITLPMVSSMILVNIVYTVIDFFLKTDNTVMDRIDAIGIGGRMDYGQASAMAWVYFLCVIVALGIVSLIISRRVYYYE